MGCDARETVEELRRLVELRGECELFVIVQSDSGLEILTSTNDLVHHRGMLATAKDMIKDTTVKMQAVMREEVRRSLEDGEAAMDGLKKPVRGVN